MSFCCCYLLLVVATDGVGEDGVIDAVHDAVAAVDDNDDDTTPVCSNHDDCDVIAYPS